MYVILHIRDIMAKNVISVEPDAPVAEAAKLFQTYQFTGIPVVDKEKTLVGIVTQFDMLAKVSALYLANAEEEGGKRGVSPEELKKLGALKIKDVMNPEAITLPEDATLEEAMTIFSEHHRVSSVPVVDKNKKVLGIVSKLDVLKSLQEFQGRLG